MVFFVHIQNFFTQQCCSLSWWVTFIESPSRIEVLEDRRVVFATHAIIHQTLFMLCVLLTKFMYFLHQLLAPCPGQGAGPDVRLDHGAGQQAAQGLLLDLEHPHQELIHMFGQMEAGVLEMVRNLLFTKQWIM